MNGEHIYIIQEREFAKFNENVFKVGKSKNILSRTSSYPKNSIVIFTIKVFDCDETERKVLTECREKFKNRKDIGNEYFECTEYEITKICSDICIENMFIPLEPEKIISICGSNVRDISSIIHKNLTLVQWLK